MLGGAVCAAWGHRYPSGDRRHYAHIAPSAAYQSGQEFTRHNASASEVYSNQAVDVLRQQFRKRRVYRVTGVVDKNIRSAVFLPIARHSLANLLNTSNFAT